MKKHAFFETVRSFGIMFLFLVCAMTIRYAACLPQNLH